MIYLLPVITACIGWLLNSLAVKMLFRPVQPVKLGFITLQGVFPKRQQALAQQIGTFAGEQLFSFAAIRTKLTDPEKVKAIIPVVEAHLDTFLREKLPKAMPVLSMFIGDSIVNQIKTLLVAELDTLFPVMISQYLDNIEQELDLKKIVSDKIAGISATQLEATTTQLLHRELRSFKWLGALTGFISGTAALLFHYFL
ncbi:DUF445 domain-containing protein [Chitinophaga solisilvae]|uniref:DUF445 family protein n=1 Tax=Chitinophaga solisilvae TaxID=1233460 RepID=A0A3S1JIY3_9BACT|nr:DUF445 family protein [Chitinophaga solisilvae]NSL87779.1 DUF445 family protein [Chitinophaga solisilvae]